MKEIDTRTPGFNRDIFNQMAQRGYEISGLSGERTLHEGKGCFEQRMKAEKLTCDLIVKNPKNIQDIIDQYGLDCIEATDRLSGFTGYCSNTQPYLEFETRAELETKKRQQESRNITKLVYSDARFFTIDDAEGMADSLKFTKNENRVILSPSGLLAVRCRASGINLKRVLEGTIFHLCVGYLTRFESGRGRGITERMTVKTFRVWDDETVKGLVEESNELAQIMRLLEKQTEFGINHPTLTPFATSGRR